MKPLEAATIPVGSAAVGRAAVSAPPPAWLAWALPLLAAAPALGVSYLPPTDEALLDGTPVVVYGVVGASQPAPFGDRIETDHLFQVTEVIKGFVPAGTIMVRELGGVRPDGRGMVILGAPTFTSGDRMLLFLSPGDAGVYRVRGLGIGMFYELDGRLVQGIGHPSAHETIGDGERSGGVVAASRDAVRFRQWLRDRAGGVEREADYFEPVRPEAGPSSVASPYELLAATECSGTPWLRWPIFDGGERQEYSTHEDGQPGVGAQATLDRLRAGAAIWTEVEGSKAAVALTSQTQDTFSATEMNGTNYIMFEDPEGDLPGELTDVGILAAAFTHYDCEGVYVTAGGSTVVSIVESNLVTQNGLGAWMTARSGGGPGDWFEEILAHEMGHGLGLGHSCEVPELQAGTCPEELAEALMVAAVGETSDGAFLADDDIAGINSLYDVNDGPVVPYGGDGGDGTDPEGPPVSADFEVPPEVTAQVPATFDASASSGADRFEWDFGDRSPKVRVPGHQLRVSHTYAAPGAYFVTLVAETGDCGFSCRTKQAVRPVVVGFSEPSVASFDLAAECSDGLCEVKAGAPAAFTDTSTGSVAERQWDFGDGTTSAEANPTHSWAAPGFYRVTLTVSLGDAESAASLDVRVSAGESAGSCATDRETMCLQDGRFGVSVKWWTAGQAEQGVGRVVRAGTNDSGLFHFFGADNWEVLVKVLDGCALNGRFWFYSAATTDLGYAITVTDTAEGGGASAEYVNEAGRPAPAVADSQAFVCGGAAAAAAAASSGFAPGVVATAVSGTPGIERTESESNTTACIPSADTICLRDGRFEVRAVWRTSDGRSGKAEGVGVGSTDSTVFHFFGADNWEMLVKVLDGCGVNEHHWVYAALATDLGYLLTVTDTRTGAVRVYQQQPGAAGQAAVVDSRAFPDSCSGAAS